MCELSGPRRKPGACAFELQTLRHRTVCCHFASIRNPAGITPNTLASPAVAVLRDSGEREQLCESS